jgi:hypothetical protein
MRKDVIAAAILDHAGETAAALSALYLNADRCRSKAMQVHGGREAGADGGVPIAPARVTFAP